MVLGFMFIAIGLSLQSYCNGLYSGCTSLIFNPTPLYLLDGLGALVFIAGLIVLIVKYR
jgi:hypothetical protein